MTTKVSSVVLFKYILGCFVVQGLWGTSWWIFNPHVWFWVFHFAYTIVIFNSLTAKKVILPHIQVHAYKQGEFTSMCGEEFFKGLRIGIASAA